MWNFGFLCLFKINGNFVAQVLSGKEATSLSAIRFCCGETHFSPNLTLSFCLSLGLHHPPEGNGQLC